MNHSESEQTLAEALSWPALIIGMAIGLSLFVSGFALQQRFFQLDISEVLSAYWAGSAIALATLNRVDFHTISSLIVLFVLTAISICISVDPDVFSTVAVRGCAVILSIMLGYFSLMVAANIAHKPHQPEHQQMLWAAMMIGAAIATALLSYVLLPMFNLYVMLLIMLQLLLVGWWMQRPYLHTEIRCEKIQFSKSAFLISFLMGAAVFWGVDHFVAKEIIDYWAGYGLVLALKGIFIGVIIYLLRTRLMVIGQHVLTSMIALWMASIFVAELDDGHASQADNHLRARMIHTVFSDDHKPDMQVALWNATRDEYELIAHYIKQEPHLFSTQNKPYDLVMVMSASSYERPVVHWWSLENLSLIRDQLSHHGSLVMVGKKPMLNRQIKTLLEVFEQVHWIRESDGHYILMAFTHDRTINRNAALISQRMSEKREALGLLNTEGENDRWMNSDVLPPHYRQAKPFRIVYPEMAFRFKDVVLPSSQEGE